MGETEGETVTADARPSEEPEVVPTQDSLQVPAQKKRKLKSPTPGSLRGRSATPIRGRSQTPFTLYMTRRSATPSTWRSITPFLKREEKEKTPFELGRDIKMQTTCNIAVFDRALIMDISEPEDVQKPVRYITSDMSVIDRAAVMDVSNVEVIYVVEEYEEVEEEEIIEEVKPKKKPRQKKGRTPRKSVDKERSPSLGGYSESEADGADYGDAGEDREESVELDEEEPAKKGKKKAAPKKKEKKEKSPSPKLTLKLEIGGGQKASKKMFEQQEQKPAAGPKPPPKKSKLVLQMEEQAKLAAKAAEEEANRAKPKGETFEERQKRLQAEKEEQERIEAEQRALEEAEAEEEAEDVSAVDEGDEDGSAYGGGSAYDAGEGNEEDGGEYPEDDGSEFKDENEGEDADDAGDEKPPEKRRGSDSSDDFVRPDPNDEERWQRIAQIEGEEFMQQMRKYSEAKRRSEKERDADWQKRREQARLPHFINFLTDRTCQSGNNVRLACAVDGPELSVKWFKDGRQLERDATHRIINNNNILTLEVLNTTILDSGEYSCVIANMNDEVYSSCIVTIYEVFKDEPQPPSFRLIKEYYHLRDDELTIECHVHGVPRPVITWWRGPYQITPSYKFTLLEEAHGVCKLLIYKPSNKDSGIYICRATNSSGEVQITHTVEVAKNRHYHVPGIFHARDRIQQAKEKEAKKAMDEAMKSMAESETKRAAVEEEQRARTHRATPEPMVSPKQKLKFATQLRDRMALEGTTVKFMCTVIGPSPAIRWMKDDKWVVVSDNIRNLSTEDKGILELKNVTSESSGVYKCVAKNDHCEIETSCYFKAYAARTDGDEHEPMFALPLRDVYHSSENDLIIDTKVRGNPRPKISWVKDNLPVVLDDRIVQIEHLDGLCELIINKPTPNDSGVYNCIAENKLGSQKITHTVVVEVQQVSRRSSILSSIMNEQDSSAKPRKSIKDGDRPPKMKKSEEEEGTYERRSKMPDPSPKQQLYFTANLSNRYVAEGSKVKLQAVVGGPDPMLKWQKDGQNVTYGPRIRNMNREGLASLEFLNAQPEDSGTYTIHAQNEWCKIETSAMLHVYQPKINTDVQPVFVRPLKDTYRLNTNELILETGVRGNPTPQVQWFKDSVEIERGGRFQILEHQDGTCELIIDYPSNKDSGKYVVKAENRAGKMEVSHYVLFEGKDHHIADNIHGVFHADKNLLRPKAEPEKPKPKEEAQQPGEAPAEDKKSKRRASRRKDESEDEGVSSATDYASDTGSLKKREKNIGIHFATYVKDRIVAEGSKIKLTCFLEAKEPQVKWFKNDEQIVNGPKMRGRYSEGLCLLEINSASLEDSGEYKCWARDESGEVFTTCKLEVYEDPGTGDVPPTFTRNIKDTYHGKINELQLDVHVRGLPTPTVTWVKDGVKIEPSEKYQQIDHDDGTCELFISNPVPADSGKYVCQAENREGKSEVVHPVTVEPRVRRPRSPPREPRPSLLPPTDDQGEQKEKKGKKKDEETEGGSSRREVPPPPDLKKKLYFRNFLSNRTVKSGSNVKWMVNIDGPEPTAKWFHGDQPIAFGPKSKMSCQDGIAWLNLIGVTEEDAGEYTLRVRGPENEIISTCNLFVYSTNKEELIAPAFTVGIKDTYCSEGNELVLECKVSGSPKPLIYWQHENLLLPVETSKYSYKELPDGIKQLIIANPSANDSGVYTCYAENESGQMKISKFLDLNDYIYKRVRQIHNSKLEPSSEQKDRTKITNIKASEDSTKKEKPKDIKMKLSTESAMKSITLASGNKAQLICYVKGFIEEVYWLRGNERVTKDTRHKIYNINGAISLAIYDARPEDTAEYKCVVKNNKNSVENVCKMKVYDSNSNYYPPAFLSPIEVQFDPQHNEIILQCVIHGRPIISWLHDSHTISNNRYKVVESVGGVRKLIIRNPIPSDCGTFSCFAENEESVESVSKIIRLSDFKQLIASAAEAEFETVRSTYSSTQSAISSTLNGRYSSTERTSRTLRALSNTKPKFTSLLHDVKASKGSNICLTCNVEDICNTRVTWLKNKEKLTSSSRYQQQYANGIATLEIFSLTENDVGYYTCVASNDYGESKTHAEIHLYGHKDITETSTVFTQAIRDTYSLNENELVLDCRVRAKPRPEIQWMKGNDMIENNEKYRLIDQADGQLKLIISNPTEKDAGLYSCVARNEVAENKISHLVDFAGRERVTLEKTHGFFHRDPNKPHFLVPLGNQTVCNGGTVAISAEFMQTNSPIEVHWFRNRQSVHGQPNVKTIVEKGVHTLTIMNATADVEGTYTCRASNAFGRIESHANVDVAVGVEKDERPPLFLSRPETEMKIAVGDPFSISFRIAGDPKPKLTFMKGTKDITKSDRMSKEVSDDYTRFTVQKSTISDSGTYFVVARNNFGTDRVFVTVTIKPRARSETPTIPRWGQTLDKYSEVSYFKDPPGPISTEPVLVDASPTHLSLSWGKPVGDNSAPVVAYKVDMWIVGHEGGAMWRDLGLTPINSFDAFNLKSNTQYHFRVTPKNRYGWGPSVQTTIPLEVGGAESLPEFIKILPGQVKALIGSKFTLECIIRGSPRPEVRWYKDGISIGTYSDRIQIKQIGPTCLLTFMCVCEEDFGRYSCEAINSKGRVSTFARLQVIHDQKLYEADTKLRKITHQADSSQLGDALPIFTMRLRDRRVQVKYPVRLTCQIMSYPKPEVTWYKDDQLIFANRRFNIIEDGQFYTLELTSTELDDSGVYRCTAKNELGSISCHCSLVVDKGIRAYILPEFYKPLEDTYSVQEGREIRLNAKVEAYPSVGVTWHRNGTRIRPSRRIQTVLDCNGHIELIIADCTVRDAGIYVCVASNAIGKVESICRVIVEEEPTNNLPHSEIPFIKTTDLPYSKEPLFVVKPRSSEAFEGDNVIIFCEVVGDPKPQVVWLRDFLNPEYYIDAPQFRRIGEGPEYRLEIPSAKLDFTGTYSIIAKNCHGEAKAVISLQIFAKDMLKQKQMEKGSTIHGNVETLPRFIHHLRDVRCCDGDAVTLECQVEAIPEPFILWEKDGKILSNSKDFISSYNGVKAKLSIPRIYPEDEGEYTCIAKNTIGRTLSSACIIVDMPEEKENHLSSQLRRPSRLLSATPTPISTPRSTPFRSISPMPYSSREHTTVNGGCSIERQRASSQRQPIAAPKFITIPYNRVVEEGESVRFQCVIYGNPSPWSTWDKNGLVVTPTARITLKEVDDLRSLEIDEVTFEDAGLYRITLENDFGRIEATARLDVIRSSRYSKYSSGRSVRASSSKRNSYLTRRLMGPSTAIGGRMALAAGYRGSSVSSCKFYHNNIELNEDERTSIKLTDSEVKLFVDNVTSQDEGLYTCIIQSDDYPIVTSTVVSFNNKSEPQTDIIITPMNDFIEAEEYETVDILFEVNCSEPFSYEWLRNDEILSDSPEFNHIDHGNGILCLRINDPFDIDSGVYECIVKSENNLKCKASCTLLVKQINNILDDQNLMFIKRPLAVFTTSASEANFFARVHPTNAETSWYVCGTKISDDSENYKLESSEIDGSRRLQIYNANLQQSGEVQLSITYPGKLRPTIHTYTSLVVLPQTFNINSETEQKLSPLITTGPKDCTALIGSSIELNVLFKTLPEATVQWFKGSREVVEDENLSILSTENSSTLRIAQIRADDRGKYSVNIMNEYGIDTASSSVAVEGPPDPPSGKPCVTETGDSILIEWCGPPYDGGCMLTGFVIEMQECLDSTDGNANDDGYMNSTWIEVATVVGSLSYTFKSLSAKGKCRFRVRAKNVHGLSFPGMLSDAINLSSGNIKEYGSAAQSLSIRSGGDFKNRFEIIEELGKGRFGVVYKVQEKEEPNRILAAKIIKCIKSQDRQKVKEEISIMSSLKHPKLLQLAASFESPREIVMVMEYITGGELFERVVADDFTLTELDCILFMRQVCEGVAYMHTQSIVHLDLKPENIMCHTRNSHQIKIIDFGLAQRLNTDAPVRVLFGTPEFIPPEIISYEPIGFQSDMWSVGVICYVLLSGLSPFMGDTDNETFSNITRAEYDFDDDAFDIVSEEAKEFIQNLLLHRKEDRWSATQCLESKWLTQGHDENLNNNKICTDKLKKFIIRRKWQKTGNAIRALGRMLNLSASRRNSAVSTFGSNPSSPRPSISGISLFYPGVPTQMTSLFEEDDKVKDQTNNEPLKLLAKPLKIEDKSHCSERSDSGYSECSNGSGFPLSNSNSQFNKKHAVVQQSKIDETLDDTSLSFSIPYSLFDINFRDSETDTNIRKISKQEQVDVKHSVQETESKPPIERKVQTENKKSNLCYSDQSGVSKKTSSTAVKEPIMPSDFTNTIKMRKKSLENNCTRGKVKQSAPIVYEPKGRVSSLKSKFSCNSKLSIDACKQSNSNKCMDQKNARLKTSTNSSTFNKGDHQTKSMPNSPLFLRSNSTISLKCEEKSNK